MKTVLVNDNDSYCNQVAPLGDPKPLQSAAIATSLRIVANVIQLPVDLIANDLHNNRGQFGTNEVSIRGQTFLRNANRNHRRRGSEH